VAVVPQQIEVVTSPSGDDLLAGFDTIVAEVMRKSREAAERSHHDVTVQEQFTAAFAALCQSEVRPAMQAVLERLQHAGGGGMIEEHAGDEARVRNARLTMWMSLEGEINGDPRPDRHPYLEFDADMVGRKIQVSEGDMWRGAGGGRSGRVGVWELTDITRDRVVRELLAIAKRAAA